MIMSRGRDNSRAGEEADRERRQAGRQTGEVRRGERRVIEAKP